METDYRFADWFTRYWSRGGLATAVVLLLLSPFLLAALGFEQFLVFLLLPAYMLHQYEEHARGRFKVDVQNMLPAGFGQISNTVIFWVNIGLVWGLYTALLYLTHYVAPALGLLAAYTTLLNGVIHIAMAARLRRYNAGLWTAIVLFLPLGIYTIYALGSAAHATAGDHLLGIAAALFVHAITFVAVIRSARRERALAAPQAAAR